MESKESLGMYENRKNLELIRPAREKRIVERCKQLNNDESAYWFFQVYNRYFDDICGGGKVTFSTMKWFSHDGLTMLEKALRIK